KWELDDLTVLTTNSIVMRDETVVCYYRLRNWIEVFYREAKSELGAGDYQVRSLDRIVRHWMLCFVAYSLIQWLQHGERLSEIAKKNSTPSDKPSEPTGPSED
ncbi:transposase, partial [Planctomycetota bacterium]